MLSDKKTSTRPSPLSAAQPALVLRKCACGGGAGMSGDCPECDEKRLGIQRKVSRPDDELELQADRMAADIMGSLQTPAATARSISSGPANPLIQRSRPAGDVVLRQSAAPERREPAVSGRTPQARQAPPSAEAAPAPKAASAGLIVEDDAPQVAPGQMRKSQFLNELKTSVCAAADAELAAVGRSALGCPYIENWIDHYRSKDSSHVERALHKYAPEAAGITSARDYIPIVSNRIRRSVSVWATTGKITGVPEELAGQIPGGGLLGGLVSGIASAVGGLLSGIGSAVSTVAGGIGKAFSAIGSLFHKPRDGGAKEADPEQIRSRLGHGQPLDGGVKSRMESAFGHDFSRVRVHNDERAAELSTSLNARAFTLGQHVAFGPGEYHPSTIAGDALIAHELAHVVQQGISPSAAGSVARAAPASAALEEDADRTAVGAVASLWGRAEADGIGSAARPRLSSGLRLARCHHNAPGAETPAGQGAAVKCPTSSDIEAMKTGLKSDFGFADVTQEGSSCWTEKELKKLTGALGKIPADQRAALQGVTLKRVAVSSCTGGEIGGCFIPKFDKETGRRQNSLEIADPSFAEDKEIEDPSVAKTREYDLAGKLRTMLPSQRTVLHEVGHAEEVAELGPKQEARFKADVEATQKQTDLDAAIKQFNKTSLPVNTPAPTSPAETAYFNSIIQAAKALVKVIDPVNGLPKDPTVKELQPAALQTGRLAQSASAAVDKRRKARKALPAKSSAVLDDVESAQDANLAACQGLATAMQARLDSQVKLESTKSAEQEASATITIGTSKATVSKRLAQLVAILAIKGIDIKKSRLRDYVKDKWPSAPGEVFADLYQMSVSEAEALRSFDPDVADFFTPPIGPKKKIAAKVSEWIKTH
jgi:hypothetical protein